MRKTLPLATAGALTIVLASQLAYLGTLNNAFVWDTIGYLNNHEFWISSLRIEHVLWMLTAFEMANWHPLTWFSWALDYRIYGGLDTAGFHLTNNIIHSFNSLLLASVAFRVYQLTWASPSHINPVEKYQVVIAACFAGLLFAVHPLHIQSVAWVAERKDLLCQLFLLAAILSYLGGTHPGKSPSKASLRLTGVFFLLALLSKPMAVTLPAVLLVLDFYPLQRMSWPPKSMRWLLSHENLALLKEKIPFMLLSLLSILMTVVAQGGDGAIDAYAPLWLKSLNAFNSLWFYLSSWIWPSDFSILRPFELGQTVAVSWQNAVPVIGFLLITVLTTRLSISGSRAWLAAWLFFLITLSPVIGIVKVGTHAAAERYTYFPMLALYLLSGALLGLGSNRFSGLRRISLWTAALLIVLVFTNKTRHELGYWQNPLTLWSRAVELYPNDPELAYQKGFWLVSSGEYEGAVVELKRAMKRPGWEAESLQWMSVAYARMQMPIELMDTWSRLGHAYMVENRFEDALSLYLEIGSQTKGSINARINETCLQYNIGWNFARLGYYSEARDLFGRIDSESELHEDATQWLNWLDEVMDSPSVPVQSHRLPSVCDEHIFNLDNDIDIEPRNGISTILNSNQTAVRSRQAYASLPKFTG